MSGGPCRLELGPLCIHLDILAGLRGAERLGFIIGASRGEAVVAAAYYAVGNWDGSPTSFTADPLDTIVAHKVAWALGLDVVAFFHSHPHGLARPSKRDIASMRLWPVAWVIGGRDGLRAYRLDRSSGALIECMVDCGSSRGAS